MLQVGTYRRPQLTKCHVRLPTSHHLCFTYLAYLTSKQPILLSRRSLPDEALRDPPHQQHHRPRHRQQAARQL